MNTFPFFRRPAWCLPLLGAMLLPVVAAAQFLPGQRLTYLTEARAGQPTTRRVVVTPPGAKMATCDLARLGTTLPGPLSGMTLGVASGREKTTPLSSEPCTAELAIGFAFNSPVCAGTGPFFPQVASGAGYALATTGDCQITSFVFELSNGSGSFASPTVLASGDSFSAAIDALQASNLPTTLPGGTGYKIRFRTNNNIAVSNASQAFTIQSVNLAAPTTPSRICQGDSLPVNPALEVGSCAFGASNQLTLQLSSATGSFANPTTLGTITAAGTTNFALPAGLPTGTGYRVRILSSNPAQTSPASLPFKIEGPSLSGVTPTVGSTPVCRGSDASVSFSLPAGSCPFPDGNVFTAQLSSATGSFNNPTNLGSVTPGQSNVTIPAGVATGSSYRIRIVSSNPALTSPNSASFQVKACNSRLSAEEAQLVVVPNPVVGRQIRVRVSGMDSPSFSLTTSTGRSLEVAAKSDGAGEHVLTSRQVLSAGVYLLQASEGTARLTQRVLVSE